MNLYIDRLLENNKLWVREQLAIDPEYFSDSAEGQSPELLWLGCSDSRVLPNEMTGAGMGEFFVHRNIANLVSHTDFNFLSVLKYAVSFLKVKHIIVCGHYECGGVKAAMGDHSYGFLDHWLMQIKDTMHFYEEELELLNESDRFRKLVEYNVIEQVNHLGNSNILREAWGQSQPVQIHGWVYDLHTGLIKTLMHPIQNPEELKLYCKFEKK
jgi:carbonic anhydrase